MASPTLRSSPSPSDVSLDEGASVQAKKITIDLEAKEVQPGVLELPSEDIPVIDRVNEGVAGDRSWLAAWASKGVWHHFIYCMIPVDVESWAEVSVLSKTIQLLQVPIFLIFRITIPTVLENFSDELPGVGLTDEHCDKLKEKRPMETVVEETESETSTPTKKESPCFNETAHTQLDLEAMHGWCKPLNVIQCAIVPTLWALLLTANGGSVGLSSIGNSSVPIFAPFLLVGLILALVVYLTSKWNEPPRLYHRPFFATLGFVTSIIWIYALAHELVNSLETLGIVWEISEAILGLSIMALASSIGDIMANCLLARNGYPRIAYSACIGSPLFNLLLGAGLSYTIKISRGGDGYASLSFTLTQAVLFSCLMAVLASNIAVALVMKFHFHRLYGILLILVYIAFVTIAILIEMDIIVSPKKWGLATGTE
ncbi:unnamed protein product [Dicrocoelium dendriticum]|nr:unnamed protein product [Dicrocoelium dendriticum]